MICAYSELIAERAYDSLGRMLDFSVRSLHMDAGSVMKLFVASQTADSFGRGDIRLICGMSGIELAYGILDRSGISYERTVQRNTASLSSEYWVGYAIARMQRESALGFDVITGLFSPSDMISEYSKLRLEKLDSLPLSVGEAEKKSAMADLGHGFSEEMCRRLGSMVSENSLRIMRKKNGLSQSALAKASGIPVRTIQQYEQGQKDIRKARAEYIVALSRVLSCDPASLLDPSF